ncbi:MAG TPA: cysteine desulfurase family protein [Bryobacteraceae bacterium]|jgi:cysteine desulfurase|nr:cysteine desulfurase family protein [Bryobacteraceae bacterium]
MIYFDNNSTTRVLESVADAMRPFLTEHFANPTSAIAQFGWVAQAVQDQKKRLCRGLGADDIHQFVITSGATESNNLALLGVARANRERRHLIVSSIEHPSVMEVCERLRADGHRISLLPVKPEGTVDESALEGMLSADTLLVSVMLANNETGVIQPVASVAEAVKRRDPAVLIHTDATQAVGKMPIDLSGELSEVDLLSLSAHKFHGPKGTGALFVRDNDILAPILFGGGQQNGLRAGTENPTGLVGMVTALVMLLADSQALERVARLRSRLETGILASYAGTFVLGASANRLPTTLNVCLPNIDAEEFVDRMAARDIAISAGSACSYGARRPSYVSLAHGLSYEHAKSCIRLSLSIESTEQEVDLFLHEFGDLVGSSVHSLRHKRETE